MSCWLACPVAPSSRGPVDGIFAGRPGCLRLFAGAAIAPDHGNKPFFDHHQGRNHLADALAGEILEVASFINAPRDPAHPAQGHDGNRRSGRTREPRTVINDLSRPRIFWVAVSMP